MQQVDSIHRVGEKFGGHDAAQSKRIDVVGGREVKPAFDAKAHAVGVILRPRLKPLAVQGSGFALDDGLTDAE